MTFEDGHEAFGFLVCEFYTKKNMTAVRVMLALSAHQGTLSLSLTQSVLSLLVEHTSDIELWMVNGESLACRARNSMLTEFAGSNCTHLMLVLSDAPTTWPSWEQFTTEEDESVTHDPEQTLIISKGAVMRLVKQYPDRHYDQDLGAYNTERSQGRFYSFFNTEVQDGIYRSDIETFISLCRGAHVSVK